MSDPDPAAGCPDCPFCAIAAGRLPAAIVYRDDAVTAFLDKNPINPGHTLVIPNAHVPDFFDLDDALLCRVMTAAARVGRALRAVTHPLRVGLLVAGFDVPHAHVHVVPMHAFHDLTSQKLLDGTRGHPSAEELAEMAAAVAGEMGRGEQGT